MNPLMFYQNYHVVHHIHPGIPFYLWTEGVEEDGGGLPRPRCADQYRVGARTNAVGVPRVAH
jgi:fatty acid desaturase